MGRKRRKNKHLPPRMALDNGTYYWRPYVDGKQQQNAYLFCSQIGTSASA